MEKDFTSHTTNINPKRFPNFPVNCPHFWCYIYNIVSQYLSLSLSVANFYIIIYHLFVVSWAMRSIQDTHHIRLPGSSLRSLGLTKLSAHLLGGNVENMTNRYQQQSKRHHVLCQIY